MRLQWIDSARVNNAPIKVIKLWFSYLQLLAVKPGYRDIISRYTAWILINPSFRSQFSSYMGHGIISSANLVCPKASFIMGRVFSCYLSFCCLLAYRIHRVVGGANETCHAACLPKLLRTQTLRTHALNRHGPRLNRLPTMAPGTTSSHSGTLPLPPLSCPAGTAPLLIRSLDQKCQRLWFATPLPLVRLRPRFRVSDLSQLEKQLEDRS